MLIDRAMPELAGEAIVLRHRSHFPDEVIKAAEERLKFAGANVDELAAVQPTRRETRQSLEGQLRAVRMLKTTAHTG